MNEYPHLITIQTNSYISDGSGGRELEWADFITDMPALVIPSSTRWKTTMKALTEEVHVDYRIFVEYDSRVKPDMRVIYENEPYEMKAVIDQGGQHEVMALMCVSKDGD